MQIYYEDSINVICSVPTSDLSWEIVNPSDFNTLFLFNAIFDEVGSKQYRTVRSTTIKAELTFGNSSYITSRLSIFIPIVTDISVILCNEHTFHLNISVHSKWQNKCSLHMAIKFLNIL